MTFKIHTLLLVAGALSASIANAQVKIDEAWVRATVPQQKATGAFMKLTAAKDTRLVAVTTPLTPKAEVHEMAMQDNVMRMRQIPAIELPAGKTVELKPGGFHLMFQDLTAQVKAGDQVPLTLIFEDRSGARQTVEVKAPARALNAAMPAKDDKGTQGGGHGDHAH